MTATATATPSQVNGVNLAVLNKTIADVQGDPELGKCKFRARNKWMGATHNRSEVTGFYGAKQEFTHSRPFSLEADEPQVLAGDDQAPNPAEHLLNALAGCITTSMVAHAAVRGIEIEELESELEGDLDLNGFLGLDPQASRGFTDIRVTFRVKTDEENLRKLRELAEFSPIYNTIVQGAHVDIDMRLK